MRVCGSVCTARPGVTGGGGPIHYLGRSRWWSERFLCHFPGLLERKGFSLIKITFNGFPAPLGSCMTNVVPLHACPVSLLVTLKETSSQGKVRPLNQTSWEWLLRQWPDPTEKHWKMAKKDPINNVTATVLSSIRNYIKKKKGLATEKHTKNIMFN